MDVKKFLESYPSVLFGNEGDEVFITFRLILNGEIFFVNSFHDSSSDNGMSSDKYIHNGFSVMTYNKLKGADNV